MEREKREQIEWLMTEKMDDWRRKVEGVELDDLRVNVFLAAAMDMKEPEQLIQWGVHQHLERSLVTSFGFLIEKIALLVADGETHRGQGGDIVVERDGKTYYIEIKSGTASSNVKMMRNTSSAQATIKDENGKESVVTVLGLTYGKPDEVFSTMRSYYEGDELLVGRNFWEFLADAPDAHRDVLDAIVNARRNTFQGAETDDDEPSSLQEAMDLKVETLTDAWKREHGATLTYDTLTESFF